MRAGKKWPEWSKIVQKEESKYLNVGEEGKKGRGKPRKTEEVAGSNERGLKGVEMERSGKR